MFKHIASFFLFGFFLALSGAVFAEDESKAVSLQNCMITGISSERILLECDPLPSEGGYSNSQNLSAGGGDEGPHAIGVKQLSGLRSVIGGIVKYSKAACVIVDTIFEDP